MTKVVKFDLTGTPTGVSSFYVRITDTSRTELFSGTVNIVDDSVEITVPDIAEADSVAFVYGHNYEVGNEAGFRCITGTTRIKEV